MFAELKNRAGESCSPYVRLHAETPIAWQFLDEFTIYRAKEENKPIFMHIGFLADHQCRLTTQDSFFNPQFAEFVNEAFIPIIIDREERPDIDTIYQSYSEAVNRAGGWPLNLFLTPDLYPFLGELYWTGPGSLTSAGAGPPNSDIEQPPQDLLALAKRTWGYWQDQEQLCRTEACQSFAKLLYFAQEGSTNAPGGEPRPTLVGTADLDIDNVDEALTAVAKLFDPDNGGFLLFTRGAKFPLSTRLSFLLRISWFPQEVRDVVGENMTTRATDMALCTLRRIRDGGLRDHVGSGFMRYSVTSDWGMPRFEKMVSDNTLLLGVFLDAWLSTSGSGDKSPERLRSTDEFADVVLELGDYLTGPDILKDVNKAGSRAFISSEAADSLEKKVDVNSMREGAYYLWTRREFDDMVSGKNADKQHESLVAATYWNVHPDGNIPRDQDPHDEFINQNVLNAKKNFAELSKQFGIPELEVERIIGEAKLKLRSHREKERGRPLRDEKIVVNTNGLAISALARAGAAIMKLDSDRSAKYLEAAKAAAKFVRNNLWVLDERIGKRFLRRFYCFDNASSTVGFADDYAFLIEGLLDLYEATLENEWLKWAKELQDTQTELFYDFLPSSPQSRVNPTRHQAYTGGFYSTRLETSKTTILRVKSGMDKTQPSTNGVSVMNLFRLGTLLQEPRYLDQAKETINAFEAEILQHPGLYPSLLSGVVTARLGVKTWEFAVGDEKRRAEYYTMPRAEARALCVVDPSVLTLEDSR
ncbi:spermatogenesis-associated protein 20 [Rhypophila decipiens]